MKWYEDKVSNISSMTLPALYKVNEDIYDSIEEISNGVYKYSKKCGIGIYISGTVYTNYITDGETVIYELPIEQQTEEIIDLTSLQTMAETNNTIIRGAKSPNVQFDFALDRRYEEFRTVETGKSFASSVKDIDVSDSRLIDVLEIESTQDNVNSIPVNSVLFNLPITLNTGDRLVWQGGSKQCYIYYPANENEDVEYIGMDLIQLSELAAANETTVNSTKKILYANNTTSSNDSSISYTSINDKTPFGLKIYGKTVAASILPIGYTQVEYVASGSNQYVDLQYYPNIETTKLIMDFSWISDSGQSYQSPFGTRKGNNTETFYLATIPQFNARNIWVWSTNFSTITSHTWQINQKYNIELSRNAYIQNGTVYEATSAMKSQTGICSNPLYLFSRDNDKTASNYSNTKIYKCQIYESDVLVHDYIPCTNPSGVAGFYDIIGGAFYKSATSKPLTAGARDTSVSAFGSGVGGTIGGTCAISVQHIMNSTTETQNISLTYPIFEGDYVDIFAGTIVRSNGIIESYNGETIPGAYESSTGDLSTGAVIIYKLSEPTQESITAVTFTNGKATHTYSVIDYEEVQMELHYDATNYDVTYDQVEFDADVIYDVTDYRVNGTAAGIGTPYNNKYSLDLQMAYNNQITTYKLIFDKKLYVGDYISFKNNVFPNIFVGSEYHVKYSFIENVEFSITYCTEPNITSAEKITVSIPRKKVRELSAPINIVKNDSANVELGYGKIEWPEVYGATEYTMYVNGDEFLNIDNHIETQQIYIPESEFKGEIYLVAKNDLTYSLPSSHLMYQSVPNSIAVQDVDTIYENNRYYVTIKFKNTSNICDSFDIVYTLDGSTAVVKTITNTYELNDVVEYQFTSPSIAENMTLQVKSVNTTGSNDYIDPIMLVTNGGFDLWTYKTALNQVLLTWIDTFTDEDGYAIKYKIDNGDWNVLQLDGGDELNARMRYNIDLFSNQTMTVCIAIIRDGRVHIYSRPITVGKSLDQTLIAPTNFAGSRLQFGELQYTWNGNYSVNHSYELVCTSFDGTIETIQVPKNADDRTLYTYLYHIMANGYVTAKVRMKWELGESEYSESIVVYNIPVTSTPPTIVSKTKQNGQMIITWEYLDYVKKYKLYLTVNGEDSVVEQVDFVYAFDIPEGLNIFDVAAKVQAVFIDDTETDISDSIQFKICNEFYDWHSTIYTPSTIDHDIYTVVKRQQIEAMYNLYAAFMNHFEKDFNFYEKSCQTYLFSAYPLYDWFVGRNLTASAPIWSIFTNHTLKDYWLYVTSFDRVNYGYDVNSLIYTPASVSYPLYVSITKLIIACFGDSITAGHPNYWAETGTGEITSQYEYWLSRRLKDKYEVLNKGYGQEKTDDMLERFDRDISPSGAHYCIILGGTNDWYQDASTKDLATGYTVMDGAIDNIKQMVSKCWDNNIYAIVCTLTPRNDITEDGKILFDYFNDWVKQWTTEQSLIGKKCAYIDFFNAGKDADPPTPLEDPTKPYHLNPLYDGDNVYDADGNLIRSGLGVHMSIEGYKVMGYSIPLTLFSTDVSGFKLYKDSQCQSEEYLNATEASNKYYEISIQNVRRGIEKIVMKYIKNVSNYPCLYYIYVTDDYNLRYDFIDESGNTKKVLIGMCNAGMVKPLKILLNSDFGDYTSRLKIHMVTRELTSVSNTL